MLATARSPRTRSDRELVRWQASEGEVARVAARIERGTDTVDVDVILRRSYAAPPAEDEPERPLVKLVRVNGLPRRLSFLLGQVNVVMFRPEDIDLVTGAPALRRRYLDVLLSQVDPDYARTLARYGRVLVQRNHLLRRITEGLAGEGELEYWDGELAHHGVALLTARLDAVAQLAPRAAELHARIAGQENLAVEYAGTVEPGVDERSFGRALAGTRRRELALGATMIGPHRDDLRFLLDGRDLGVYGSRGQQRSAALVLRLAEAGLMQARRGEPPVLLLDDVLSELDARRRQVLLNVAHAWEQTLLTTSDLDLVAPSVRRAANLCSVARGSVTCGS